MVWWVPLAAAAIGAAGDSGAAANSKAPNLAPIIGAAPNIQVAPVGLNLGEIMRPLIEGSLTNGGSGLDVPSRWLPSAANMSRAPAGAALDGDMVKLLLFGGLAVAVLAMMKGKRRG